MKHVVILDDDAWQLDAYLSELEVRGVRVSVATDLTEFMEILVGEVPIDLFVLDVMVPTGSLAPAFPEVHTANGMDTGILLAMALRHSDIEIPIVMFSVAWSGDILERIKGIKSKYTNIAYLSKAETFPSDFGNFIGKLLEDGKVKKGFFSFLPIIGDALVLRPSFCGVGVDIKKLLKWG